MNWKEIRREKRLNTYLKWTKDALERDKYSCKDCGVKEVELLVHHLDESRKLGIKNMNNDLGNLITLCRKCHAIRHGFSFKSPHLKIIEELREQGRTYQEIGDYIGISRQRVHQLLKVI